MNGPRVKAYIRLRLASPQEAEALAKTLAVEARNPPDAARGTVEVEAAEDTVTVRFTARDPSSARALVNAYLTLAAATVEALRRTAKTAQHRVQPGWRKDSHPS